MLEPHFLSMTGEELDAALAKIPVLEQQVADLLYEPIDILNSKCSPATAEMGSTVDEVTISWSLNKEATEAALDGTAMAADKDVSALLTALGLTTDKAWTLTVADERGATDSVTTGIDFLNGVYYGGAAAPEAIDSAFILALEKKVLSDARARTITVTAEDGEYIWYCLPARIYKADSCTFKVGGFEGGFDLVETIAFTNSQGYTEDYCIYRSAQAGLGKTTVEVS